MGKIDQEEIEYIANTYYKKSKQNFSEFPPNGYSRKYSRLR